MSSLSVHQLERFCRCLPGSLGFARLQPREQEDVCMFHKRQLISLPRHISLIIAILLRSALSKFAEGFLQGPQEMAAAPLVDTEDWRGWLAGFIHNVRKR